MRGSDRQRDHIFSIVTVCFNAVNELETTLKSVLSQDNRDYEYVIIDGGSTDTTLCTLKRYQPRFEGRMRFISGMDEGIYDAMNKGIGEADGEYANFLNTGDTYCSAHILSEVANLIDGSEDLIYGNHYRGDKRMIPGDLRRWLFALKTPFCHQAVFYRNETLRKYIYDTRYKISADNEQFLRMYLNGCRLRYLNLDICHFVPGGSSRQNEMKASWERLEYVQRLLGIAFLPFALITMLRRTTSITLRQVGAYRP